VAPWRPPDVIARESVAALSHVTSGLWLLCLTPWLLALMIALLATSLVVQLAIGLRGGSVPMTVDTIFWGVIGLLATGTSVSWTLGWWLAATPLHGNRANRIRRHLRRLALLAGAAVVYITAVVVLQTAGLQIKAYGDQAVIYGFIVLCAAMTLVGPFVLDDLGRRCEIESRCMHARWIRVLALGVVLAFVIGMPLQIYLQSFSSGTPPGGWDAPTWRSALSGSAGVWIAILFVSIVTHMTMTFGPIALLVVCCSFAFTLYPRCAAVCESTRCSPHWSARGPWGGVRRCAGWFGGGQPRVRRRAT